MWVTWRYHDTCQRPSLSNWVNIKRNSLYYINLSISLNHDSRMQVNRHNILALYPGEFAKLSDVDIEMTVWWKGRSSLFHLVLRDVQCKSHSAYRIITFPPITSRLTVKRQLTLAFISMDRIGSHLQSRLLIYPEIRF